MKTAKPFILHVDDVPDELREWESEANSTGALTLRVLHPREVGEDELRAASVVLVDFKVDEWSERDLLANLSLRPSNGLALLSVLQEAAYDIDQQSPRAFALFTAAMASVARGLVPQPHIIARAHNLDWVFDKASTDSALRLRRVASLAAAVSALPQPWPAASATSAADALEKWLGLAPAVTWRDAAWTDIIRCRPPMHEYAEHTHGTGIIRWMLHRILPYPCFLFDDRHLAARLRVELDSLKTALEHNDAFRTVFEPARYSGALSGFPGRRWWRAAVDSIIFDAAIDDPASIPELHNQLLAHAPDLRTISADTVFPLIDRNYEPKDELATADNAIEVVPDDWPPFADSAWALRADVEEDQDLKAISVSPEDHWW